MSRNKRIKDFYEKMIKPISTKRTITSHLKSFNANKVMRHMLLEIQVLVWTVTNNVARLNRLLASHFFLTLLCLFADLRLRKDPLNRVSNVPNVWCQCGIHI